MAKDALGHGSDSSGAHSAGVNSTPAKGSDWKSTMSDATWHATMPQDTYTSQISDLLGMWGGNGMNASKLSPDEAGKVNGAYGKRADWRAVAGQLHAARQSDLSAVVKKYGSASEKARLGQE
jgi:hypothetical protein